MFGKHNDNICINTYIELIKRIQLLQYILVQIDKIIIEK